MSTWLSAWRNRDPTAAPVAVLELRVTQGADAGSQFTLEGDSISIGRGEVTAGTSPHVRLTDKSISRQQARILREPSGLFLVHAPGAANSTLLNGQEIERAKLGAGDRIQMGRVTLDVLAREGTNLSGLTEILVDAARASITSELSAGQAEASPLTEGLEKTPTAETARLGVAGEVHNAGDVATETTELRPMQIRIGEIELLEGDAPSQAVKGDASEMLGTVSAGGNPCFPIGMSAIRIGRGVDAEIRLLDTGVSRLHAEVALEGGALVLFQRSRTNPTLVRGIPVLDRVDLRDGDEIQLADRVRLRVRLDRPKETAAPAPVRSSSMLSRRMEDKIDLDRSIESFHVMGTFLDVDIVSSRLMKTGGAKPEHIIVSFDRFREYVSEICAEEDGQVLNSNGDELMCFFESASSAVAAAGSILGRLAEFNQVRNLLASDFKFRLGAHSGASLVDLDAGIAYSEVLDTAGHIQKCAEPNSLVISQETLDALDRTWAVTPAGKLGTETLSGVSGRTLAGVAASSSAGTSAMRVLYRVDFTTMPTPS